MKKHSGIGVIVVLFLLGGAFIPMLNGFVPTKVGIPIVIFTPRVLGGTFYKLMFFKHTPKVEPNASSLASLAQRGGGYFPFGIKTVVIDAGHGGKDPGCLGAKYKEKDVALAIALKLGKYIEQNIKDVKVVYTRKTDVFLELHERAEIANKNKADLFICIHCNASEKKEPFGAETYVMGLHKTNANLNVAKRENSSILFEKNYQKKYDGFDPNSETGYILLTMQQNAYLKQSLAFAASVQKHLKEKAGRTDKGVQQAGFLVLWRTSMPSVLIETDFLSNPEQEKFLGSEKGQDNIARAIFCAFREYKDAVEGKFARYEDDMEKTKPYLPEKDTTKETKPDGKDSSSMKKKPVIEHDEKVYVIDSAKHKNESVNSMKETDGAAIKDNKKDSVPVTSPLQEGKDVAPGIVYKVQFMSSSQRIPLLSEKFKGIKDVGEYQDGNFYKYTAGEFGTAEEALKYRSEMQAKGFKDCFIVKFKDGKRMKN